MTTTITDDVMRSLIAQARDYTLVLLHPTEWMVIPASRRESSRTRCMRAGFPGDALP